MVFFNAKAISSFVLGSALLIQTALTGVDGQAWRSHHGLTGAAFQTQFNDYVSQGYRLTHLDGYGLNNVAYFAAIYEKTSGPAWIAKFGLTSAGYQEQFNALVKDGYRLQKINGYSTGGSEPRFAAIFDKSAGPAWVAKHGLDSAQYQAAFNTYVSQGYRLKQVSGYAVGTSVRYAALFDKSTGPKFQARHGLTSEQYQAAVTKLKGEGYRPVAIDAYTVNGQNLFAAIFEPTAGVAWEARHNLTPAQYQAEFDRLVKLGYKLVIVSGYGTGAALYAALWTK
ncbi:hypothetical protein BGZ68_009012 [Mortierella alpina]|nr:hypothetical protein BGZ68_009012 [Mortierella alpina]